MGDRKCVTGNKMSVTDINDPMFAGKSARVMARALLKSKPVVKPEGNVVAFARKAS
jgi:hypothetical protein